MPPYLGIDFNKTKSAVSHTAASLAQKSVSTLFQLSGVVLNNLCYLLPIYYPLYKAGFISFSSMQTVRIDHLFPFSMLKLQVWMSLQFQTCQNTKGPWNSCDSTSESTSEKPRTQGLVFTRKYREVYRVCTGAHKSSSF